MSSHIELVRSAIDELDNETVYVKLSDYEKSIQHVRELARLEHKYNMGMIGKKPFMGWSQEKHDNYHMNEVLECDKVLSWLFIKLMQINPD